MIVAWSIAWSVVATGRYIVTLNPSLREKAGVFKPIFFVRLKILRVPVPYFSLYLFAFNYPIFNLSNFRFFLGFDKYAWHKKIYNL
jgi:hypothetical protein